MERADRKLLTVYIVLDKKRALDLYIYVWESSPEDEFNENIIVLALNKLV